MFTLFFNNMMMCDDTYELRIFASFMLKTLYLVPLSLLPKLASGIIFITENPDFTLRRAGSAKALWHSILEQLYLKRIILGKIR